MVDRDALANWESAAGGWKPRPPLSPSPDDIAFYETAARSAIRPGEPLRVVHLGVTGAIATMNWPNDTTYTAVDFAAAMIRHAWPADGKAPGAQVVRADWLQLPLPEASADMICGDGCYTTIGSNETIARLNDEVRRVLRPGGYFAIRCFSRTGNPPAPSAIVQALTSGELTDFALFRWLLIMAMQGEGSEGVRLCDVWARWRDAVPDPETIATRQQWRDDDLASMARWASIKVRYVYPTSDELIEIAAPNFRCVECEVPDIPYGDHFPRLLFQRV